MTRAELEMTYAKETVDWIQEAFELTIREVGGALGTSSKTVQRWRTQRTAPRPEHRRELEKLNQLRHFIETSFRNSDAAQRWMHRPSPALRGKSPMAVLTHGDIDAVLKVLGTLAGGAHV